MKDPYTGQEFWGIETETFAQTELSKDFDKEMEKERRKREVEELHREKEKVHDSVWGKTKKKRTNYTPPKKKRK